MITPRRAGRIAKFKASGRSLGADGEMHDVHLSKLMSRLLRHDAEKCGIDMDASGWV